MDKDIKFLQDDLLKSGISHNNKPFKKELYEEFSKINYKEEAHLQDLSSLFCFSIDGKSTNDRDDIISFEKNIGEDTYSLGIHISNVASFIPYKSLIDIEASNRSSSIYSLNANISMLPQYFIEKFGSLDPFKLRKSLSVLIKIDADANILDSEIIVSKVENKLALKYEDVELILKDKNHKLFSLFEQLYSVCSILNNKRITKEALILDKPNMEINLLDNGEIDVRVADQIAKSKLIVSELMILYNRILAEFCYDSELPVIYRTQEKIEIDDLDLQDLSSIVKRYIVYKKMKPVAFSTNPSPHFFMGVDKYIQSTSPLRRYFDLMMQRQIINYKFYNKIIYTADDLKLIIEKSVIKLKSISKFEREREKFWIVRYFDHILDDLIQKNLSKCFVGIVLESNLNGLALLELQEIPFRFKCYIPEVCFQGDRVNFNIKNVDLMNRSVNFIFKNKI